MAWFGIGDSIAFVKFAIVAVRHRQFKVMYWSVRRRFSAERLRQQTRFVHQDLAHKARDIVAERMDFWAEGEQNVETLARSIELRLTPAADAPNEIEDVNPVRLESEINHLDEFVNHTAISVDDFLTSSCQSLSKYLSSWMPGECFVSVHILLEGQSVLRSDEFGLFARSDRFKADASRLRDYLRDHGESPGRKIAVSCARARCNSSKDRDATCFPWKIVEETTAFNSLLSAPWNDPDGHDHLFQAHDTSRSGKQGGPPYKDSSQEARLCKSVVAVPIRGFALAHEATLGFVWIDAPMPYAFLSMFQHDPDPQKRTAGLHLLHAFSDTVATVLACERNVVRAASNAKDRLASGAIKLAGAAPP